MRVAVTGSTGLIGAAVSQALKDAGHDLVRMVRRPAQGPDEAEWHPGGSVDSAALHDVDAIVHVAAESLSPLPLTPSKGERLRRSRVDGTRTIATAVAQMDDGPRVLLSSCGTAYYGDRGDEALTEDSGPGEGWLAGITHEWEAALQPARDAGLRVVAMRTGVVLARSALILRILGGVTRLGVAAPVGSGKQYWPWIALDDTAGLYLHALANPDIDGVLNVTSPNPVTNREFTRALARALGRPMLPVHVPAFLLRLALTRAYADSLLFDSLRVFPEKALASGYEFRYSNLEEALRAIYAPATATAPP